MTSLGNSTALNLLAALVVAGSVAFVVRQLARYYVARNDKMLPQDGASLVKVLPVLSALAVLFTPSVAGRVVELTPFVVALAFPALSYALVFSLFSYKEGPVVDDDDVINNTFRDPRKLVFWRLLVAGALAAVGAWESTLGVVLAFICLFLLPHPALRLRGPVGHIVTPWALGFVLAFAAEIKFLPTCSWSALAITLPPLLWFGMFLLVGIVMFMLSVLFWQFRKPVLGAWAVLLLVGLAFSVRAVHQASFSASEAFVRRCIAELGERKIVISDGYFDEMFRALVSADVKVVGMYANADREFLVNTFGENEVVTNRALVVRDCYQFPEFLKAAPEAGFIVREVPKEEAKAQEPEMPKPEPKLTPEEEKQRRVEAYKVRAAEVMKPVVESLNAMGDKFKDIPEDKRRAEIEKSRASLREGWAKGARGTQVSSMLLTLDMMVSDKLALETDALTILMSDRDDPAANAVMGKLRLADGRTDDAVRYLEKAVKGGGAMAMCDYARVLVGKGEFAEAEQWARKAVAKKPDDPTIREPLVAVLVETRQFDQADKELKAMLALVRDDEMRAKVWDFAAQVSSRIAALKK